MQSNLSLPRADPGGEERLGMN
uniref:Uncharacterized protein n=1 Tax=Arundo donax TaxID=35708 RepID=A0A0A9EAQ5_ARUDO